MDDKNNIKETSRKRKTTQELVENPTKIHQLGFNVDLNLTLSISSQSSTTALNDNNPTTALSPIMQPPPPPPQNDTTTLASTSGGESSSSRRGQRQSLTTSTTSIRSRSNGGRTRAVVKTDNITPPYPWATDKRAKVHSMEYLVSQGIKTITGDVQCKKCERSFIMEYDLQKKFSELFMFILDEDMKHRAPTAWNKPKLPTCKYCGEENSCKPLISGKKRSINWLFLLLGQVLGCCTLEQLKYFCKHTQNHRTGAKDRVLFLSYYTLCKQLDPNGPYDF